MRKESLFYVKPAMTLGSMPERFVRITPEEAMEESKKDVYAKANDYKGIYKIAVNSPGVITYVYILVEHPSVQKLDADSVYSKFVEWLDYMMYQAGFEDDRFSKKVCKIQRH